jgi:hypothetical protein
MSTFSYSEGRTGSGQLIKFTCQPDQAEEVKKFLKENIRTIDPLVSHQVSITHGSYGAYSRFEIKQHEYAAGDGEDGSWGYIEVLEIMNPPDLRAKFIINEKNSEGENTFYEWDNLDSALAAFKKFSGTSQNEKNFPKLPGFKRMVPYSLLTPWFYAIGDEELIGDYAFPEGLQDDPVFRFGNKLVCYKDGAPVIKTCMGTRYVEKSVEFYPGSFREDDGPKETYRIVVFSDGSFWDESKEKDTPPRPLLEDQLWITDAMQKFQNFLTGNIKQFDMSFVDGQKLICRLGCNKTKAYTIAGNYLIKATLEDKAGKANPISGWVEDFVPTPEVPDIMKFVEKKFSEAGRKLIRIEILEIKPKIGGKNWSGVFYTKK